MIRKTTREEQFCAHCRDVIPIGSERCPQCGHLAGEIFDGRVVETAPRGDAFLYVLVLLLLAAGAYFWWTRQQRAVETVTRPEPLPVRVVGDRPGGARKAPGASFSEAEAIRLLRRHLVEAGTKSECLAISSQGADQGNYRFTAVDGCADVRMGRWRVDARSGSVSRESLP